MKFFLASVVALVYIASVSADSDIARGTPEGHQSDLRKRLGHFKDDRTFLDLYKVYATAFVLPNHPGRDNDDYRNYLPSGDECMVFFRKFRIDDYVLRDLDDFVVLDACLGYLFESTYHEVDMAQSSTLRDNLDDYKNDQTLINLYQGTKIEQMEQGSKRCVANLLVNAIQAKKQWPDKVCNNHWIDLFNRFAACQSPMLADKDNDSYLKILYELVRARANECFDNEINALNVATYKEYANNPFSIMVNKVSYWDTLRKQQGTRYYPTKLATILKAIQGTTSQINIREVANIVRGIGLREEVFKNRLLNNMAKFADATINPGGFHIHKSSKGKDDPTGVQRYDAMVDDMCNFFRPSNSENFYDFVTPFVRMVTMLKYPEIFGISKDDFVRKVLTEGFETAALYLAVSGCNILTFTEGQFIRQPQHKSPSYKVVFKQKLDKMVQWPDVGYY